MTDELDRFAERLITQVRDEAIADLDALAARRMGGPEGKRWRTLLADPPAREAVQTLIPTIVDLTLARLLHTLDTGALPLAWQTSDGTWTPLQDLGRNELAGRLTDPEDWLPRFSTQRYDP